MCECGARKKRAALGLSAATVWAYDRFRPSTVQLSHGLGAVERLAEDVGVTGVLGSLRDHMEQHPPR